MPRQQTEDFLLSLSRLRCRSRRLRLLRELRPNNPLLRSNPLCRSKLRLLSHLRSKLLRAPLRRMRHRARGRANAERRTRGNSVSSAVPRVRLLLAIDAISADGRRLIRRRLQNSAPNAAIVSTKATASSASKRNVPSALKERIARRLKAGDFFHEPDFIRKRGRRFVRRYCSRNGLMAARYGPNSWYSSVFWKPLIVVSGSDR